MTFSDVTIEQWFQLKPGQKAKMLFDFFVQLYPSEMKGEQYQYKAGRDMKWLTDIFKIDQLATPEEAGRRIILFLKDKSPFLCKKGHAINQFDWNAYAATEYAGTRGAQRQGITEEDVRRITGDIDHQIPRPEPEERRYH